MTFGAPEREALLALELGRLRFDEPMSRHTSFRIGGPADAYVEVADAAALARLQQHCQENEMPLVFVGGGCNLLVRDGGIRGVVARLGRGFRRLHLVSELQEAAACLDTEEAEEAEAVNRFAASLAAAEAGRPGTGKGQAVPVQSDGLARVHVDAGVAVPALLKFCVRRGLAGVEGLAGVPGTVGGSLVMNAGTHEGELCSVVDRLDLIDPSGQSQSLRQEDLSYSYRRLDLPVGSLIVSAELALRPSSSSDVEGAIRDLVAYRKSTQPVRVPSAGCVFKNPRDGDPAGMLIDRAGLKGQRIGGAVVSSVHANYVVNDDKASAQDVLELMRMIRECIAERWGVVLEEEVRILGEDPGGSGTVVDRT